MQNKTKMRHHSTGIIMTEIQNKWAKTQITDKC